MRSPSELTIAAEAGAETSALVYHADPAPPARAALVLAHGAGAGQHSPFMTGYARALASRGIDVVTFNFLYTERKRRIPDRTPQLEACYRAVVDASVEHVEGARRALFIGGKSMGGRIATHLAAADAALPIAGLVLLGYPLHPPGHPDKRRDAHLPRIARPILFLQGSRDTFGVPAELAPVIEAIGRHAELHVVEGGDHSFALPRRDGSAQAAVHEEVQRAAAEWMFRVAAGTHPPRG